MVSRNHSAEERVKGFTLVELLIVMAILVVLAAVTLPTIRGLLVGQKTSEAARLVKSFVESAKARAQATGRPVAVIVDRSRYDGSGGLAPINMCTRLSMGEVFPAYTGDWAGASGTLLDLVATEAHEIGFADTLDIPLSSVASLIDVSQNPPVATSMVQVGDLIEIGSRREKFFIVAEPTVVTDSSGNSFVRIQFNNPSTTTANLPMQQGALPVATSVLTNVQFRIYRRPNKSLSGGISLPRGTCIDLHFSGFGQSGRQFSSDILHNPTNLNNPPTYPPPFPPTTTSENSNYGPIYLVFSPTGLVSAWYFQNREFSHAEPTIQRGYPSGLIHLLVGGTDQVSESPLLAGAASMVDTEDFKTNIMDSNNSWVTINPYTGGISTTSVQSTTTLMTEIYADVVQQRIAQSRLLATNALAETTQ